MYFPTVITILKHFFFKYLCWNAEYLFVNNIVNKSKISSVYVAFKNINLGSF